MNKTKTINVAKDFTRYPAGRYLADGPFSGERFRDEFLIPALRDPNTVIVVQLDGARGLASSFLEEAFGGLVRAGFQPTQLIKQLQLESQDISLIHEILQYIQQETGQQ